MRNKKLECRNIISIIVIAAMLLFGFAGCGKAPVLFVTGDCDETGFAASFNFRHPLKNVISISHPRADEFDVYLVGNDGMIARVSGEELDGCEVVYSKENAWEIKSELHPRSVRVKDLAAIAVVPQGDAAGQLLVDDTLYLLKEEGTSQKNGRSVTVYTTRLRVPVGDEPVERIDELPELMITRVFTDAMEALSRGERVLILELDGLGWEMLQRAEAPFIKSLGPQRALAAWPPISPTGLASMLTGETADVHGVIDRGIRGMACVDIFEKARAMGKACAYIEGSHTLLKTSIAPALSLSDEEAYENARKALGNDLIFAHFHGIDEAAHAYGPYARETLEKINELDGLARALCEGFDGRVIVTADHGLHETEAGEGAHGEFCLEDMVVGYIINEK